MKLLENMANHFLLNFLLGKTIRKNLTQVTPFKVIKKVCHLNWIFRKTFKLNFFNCRNIFHQVSFYWSNRKWRPWVSPEWHHHWKSCDDIFCRSYLCANNLCYNNLYYNNLNFWIIHNSSLRDLIRWQDSYFNDDGDARCTERDVNWHWSNATSFTLWWRENWYENILADDNYDAK